MKILVLSYDKAAAQRLWHHHISQMFSGYEKPIFSNTLRKGLDGLNRQTLVIIYVGGYKPANEQEALATAWYLDQGAMFIDFNKIVMKSNKDQFKKEYLGHFYNKPVEEEQSEAEYIRDIQRRERESKRVDPNDPMLFDKELGKIFVDAFTKDSGDSNESK